MRNAQNSKKRGSAMKVLVFVVLGCFTCLNASFASEASEEWTLPGRKVVVVFKLPTELKLLPGNTLIQVTGVSETGREEQNGVTYIGCKLEFIKLSVGADETTAEQNLDDSDSFKLPVSFQADDWASKTISLSGHLESEECKLTK